MAKAVSFFMISKALRQLDKKPMLHSISECPSQSLSEFPIDIHISYNHIIKIVKKNTSQKEEPV